MGLFNRSGGARVAVTPGTASPRQTVRATVSTDKPIDKVGSARLDWGYTNFYQYHLAGRADSAAAAGNDADDWVSVIGEDVPVGTGEFSGASSVFCVPSWAPASSPEIARWECRLTIDRDGRDVETSGAFTVVIGTADVEAYTDPMEVVSGAAETVIDIALTSPLYRTGDTITGHATLTPTTDLPDGDLAVSWQRERESHPLNRAPGPGAQLNGRIVPLGKRIPLRAGVSVVLPFQIALPADAPPTAAAVHSSVNWFVQARLMYAGFTSQTLERVRRPVVVVNGP